MKLFNRFLIIYLLITLVVLAAGGVISYRIISQELDYELTWRFLSRINRVAYLIDKRGYDQNMGNDDHNDPDSLATTSATDPDDFDRDQKRPPPGQPSKDSTPDRDRKGRMGLRHHYRPEDRNIIIRQLGRPVKEHIEVSDTLAYHPGLDRMEPSLKVAAYRNINGEGYYIATFGVLVEKDDIAEAVIKTLLWILGLQILGAVGVGLIVSKRLFKPFNDTLDRIRNFRLTERKPIEAESTKVKEFNELNRFVEEMTRKAIEDYEHLKEFTENASHELQTPLAIARGKLELLQESELDPERYDYLEATERALKKISRLSKSLTLITKIENNEYEHSGTVNFSQMIRESTEAFSELVELNNLSLETDLEEEVELQMHPVLADILWTNLFQNAIKHNRSGGWIHINLNAERLQISNTGEPLNIEPEELFQRFKKADQNAESIGLGLSIVKRITDLYDFDLNYRAEDDVHTLTVTFNV